MAGLARSLFRVFVVDPRKGGKVLMDGKTVIATNEGEAQLKAGVGQVVADAGLELEQCDTYCELIAKDVIRPRKDVQKVVMAKDTDDDE